MSHEISESDSCPAQNTLTRDLDPGEIESISCAELYPSGIFGSGFTHRYCMLGGKAVFTDACQMEDIDLPLQSQPRETKESEQSLTKYGLTNGTKGTNTRSNHNDIYDASQKAQAILEEASLILRAAENAKYITDSLKKIGNNLAPAF
mmetsp:Transcript_23525/g.35730  ORF Transcript_23525/g.35730 Transcript_23525/m.35730 type:complete len:148 (+) Transcript_23525:258-701(+)